MKIAAFGLAFVLAVAPASVLFASDDNTEATAPEATVYDAASAFAFFKTMKGTWEGSSSRATHDAAGRVVDIKLTAAESVVVQTIYPGDKYEMVNTIYMDGDDLLLTHYCALQNAPRLKFQKTDRPGEIKFVFDGGTNFDPAVDAHVHEGVYQVKGADTLASTFVTYANGKAQPILEGVMVRKGSQ